MVLNGPRKHQVVPQMCCWISEMSLSGLQVKAEKAGQGRRNVSVGDSLFLVIEPLRDDGKGGGKSFEGRMGFPPGRKGKQVPVRIGVDGRGLGKWSLKHSRDSLGRHQTHGKERGPDHHPPRPGVSQLAGICQKPSAAVIRPLSPRISE